MLMLLLRQNPNLVFKLMSTASILGYVGAWGAYLLFNKRAVATP
ncbi:MAG: hypothetical protein K0S16_1500 [Moraxellaceae bacterium]|nr:hypothetical protein [Moraxellaceae bacterium]